MRYFGGKQRIAKRIAEHMGPEVFKRGRYWEPFVGGASVISSIEHASHMVGSDSNEALVSMWRAVCSGWIPPDRLSEEEYAELKRVNDPSDPMTAFAAFGLSFAGKWFGGYARGGEGRNYAANAKSSILKKARTLGGVTWVSGDYQSIDVESGGVIYCDPPYQGTTQYGACDPFSWDRFWDWCLIQHNKGSAVFVSEYSAPPEFVESLVIKTKTDIRTKVSGKEERLERVFVPRGASYA